MKSNKKTRFILPVIYLVIGAALITSKLIWLKDNEYLSALGIAFIIIGAARVVQYVRLVSDPEKLSRHEIAEKDERNIMISTKAKGLAFNIYTTAACAAMIFFMAANREGIVQIIAYNIMAMIVIYLVCSLVLRLKY